MAKEYKIKDDVYIHLIKYFDGEITNLSSSILSELKKSKFKGEPIKSIDKKILQTFSKIIQLKKEKPKVYAGINWVYTELSEDQKLEKLKEYFPEDYPEKNEDEDEKIPPESPPVLKDEYDDLVIKKALKYSFNKQVQIFFDFYNKTENVPDKTNEEVKGIINRRRNQGDPIGTPIPPVPFIELCNKLEDKYGTNPLEYYDLKKEEKEKVFNKYGEIDEGQIESVFKSVIPQRKAFINWINDVYYKKQINKFKNDRLKLGKIKKHQHFVKEYLNFDNPFRGLLIYHGLGSGKTATSVITSEGLSKSMPIFTMLPASLETNYINEVKTWGDVLFKVNENNWIFYSLKEIKDDLLLRKNLQTNFGIDESKVINIVNRTKRYYRKIIEDKDKLNDLMKKINSIRGIYLQSENINTESRPISTTTGEPILESNQRFNGECKKLKPEEIQYIEHQIDIMIELKYNFIHYNGFPKVSDIDFKELENPQQIFNVLTDDEDKKKLTDNQKLVEKLSIMYQKNVVEHGVSSPFRENVLIIDEVHNFVNEIINGSVPANIFYNWIINSEDTKLIFLSGTPVINKPAEITILFNMLRGILHVFEFSVISEKDEFIVQKELRELFYKENSPIEQLHVSKKRGKIILSFTKTKSGFDSILEDDIIKTVKYNDYSLESFFDVIFDGLERYFDKKYIIPQREQIKDLSSLNDLKMGKVKIFDEEINLIFNRRQKLFDIYDNNSILDLSNNENFMEYFFDESYNIPQKKQVLLRRMLMGLTSYYPIDSSSLETMAQVVEPVILPRYEDYKIVKKINVIPCYMSSIQWTNYSEEYMKEKMKRIQQLQRNKLYDNSNSSYNIRTRQNCNFVYEDDSFRYSKDESEKDKMYEIMSENGHFNSKKTLKLFSPKFYQMLDNISKFLKGDTPTGKILYYSDFRHDAGSEVFEQILKSEGYERFNPEENDIESLVEKKDKKKRYTFITGKESQEVRRINQDSFNHVENIRGEYIQIILISSSGAEGISLFCVRQVHIMEPFWNYIRVDQVFGRAIRMNSHVGPDPDNPWLPEEDRNVEQYLYLTMLPEGNDIEEIYTSLKDLEWNEVSELDIKEDVKNTLMNNHKSVYRTIQKILSIKKETNNRTVDQILFDIMEKKYNISKKVTDIIKQSSIDCIQNTRDDLELNQKCLRFSEKVIDEESHFPGISASDLNEIDEKQYNAKFLFFIEPDIYVTKALVDDKDLFIYYKLKTLGEEIDIRYIRENGSRICDYYPERNIFMIYESDSHKLNEILRPKFSILKSIYTSTENIETKINKNIFPSLSEIKNKDELIGYLVKYNLSEKLFYINNVNNNHIIKLYDFNEYIDNNYSTNDIKYLILRNGKLYLSRN